MPVVSARTTRSALQSLPDAHISVEGFEGPLELLLHLVDQEKIALTSVALAGVAGQYLDIVRLLPNGEHRLDFLAEFLVIGAQLLLLKSRALLPREAQRQPEEVEVDELTLDARLREYRRIRVAAGELLERQERGARSFSRIAAPPLPAPPAPPQLERAAPEQLAAAMQRLLDARPPVAGPEAPPRVTIAGRIEQVRLLVGERGRVSFLWLAADCQSRAELIVTFLAVLELYRSFAIDLEQDQVFGEIWIAGLTK